MAPALGPLLEHFREHYTVYVFIALFTLPILVIFRRYTAPTIAFVLELCLYVALLHVLVHGSVRLTAWFKDQSSMKRAFGPVAEGAADPGWTTPLLTFWQHDLYSPAWLLYFECFVVAAIVYLMWRYKPVRPQKKGTRAAPPKQESKGSSWQKKRALAKKGRLRRK